MVFIFYPSVSSGDNQTESLIPAFLLKPFSSAMASISCTIKKVCIYPGKQFVPWKKSKLIFKLQILQELLASPEFRIFNFQVPQELLASLEFRIFDFQVPQELLASPEFRIFDFQVPQEALASPEFRIFNFQVPQEALASPEFRIFNFQVPQDLLAYPEFQIFKSQLPQENPLHCKVTANNTMTTFIIIMLFVLIFCRLIQCH
jgi:hypothetical protein